MQRFKNKIGFFFKKKEENEIKLIEINHYDILRIMAARCGS